MPNYLEELNPIQRAAAETMLGPVMIIAGPGSGKTRVLTYRIAHLMDNGIDPFHILALTFTNKAAKEMKERIAKLCGADAKNLWMGTFHSIFARLLRVEAAKIGYSPNFSIYDPEDAKSLIKNIVNEKNLDSELYKPSIVYNKISAAKNNLISHEDYQKNINLRADDESQNRKYISEIYTAYNMRCLRAGALDFDDLLLKMYMLLKNNPETLLKYQNKFQFIMVDEFQDTNKAQYEIVKMLAAENRNVAIVGDDAQSIYAFRGATIHNILNFEKDYPELKIYKLEQNYRSTQSIVNAANKIITNNRGQIPKKIWTENGDGEKIKIYKAASDNEEGSIIANVILELKLRNQLYNKDFAILYRTNAQSRAFEESLRRQNISYKVYGGISFYQRKEIKDFIAYLKLIVNHNDEEALRRIINYPARGIGATSIEKINIIASESNQSMWQIVENPQLYGLDKRLVKSVGDFSIIIKSFATKLANSDAYEIAQLVGQATGIVKELHNDKSVEGVSRFENIQELLNSIKEYTESKRKEKLTNPEADESLASYLQEIMLLTDTDNEKENTDRVSLMTIHSAKGLEFPVVFLVGMEEELFPSRLALVSRSELEEERRLYYVAVTRAMRQLIISYAATRYRYGKLIYCEKSRFIDEIPPLDIEMIGSDNSRGGRAQDVSEGSSISALFRRPNNLKPLNTQSNLLGSNEFSPTDTESLSVGQSVMHERFGKGKIEVLEGNGKDKMAHIHFENVGVKKIILRFTKLQLLG